MEKSKRDKDFEDGFHIDKTQVLQEARQCFMATSERTEKLVDILTKCIYILLQGEKLAPNEATDLFFCITQLFQYKNKDITLRRLTYIGIRALSRRAENVYVVIPSLTNDVKSPRDDPGVRASALRALCQISDLSALNSIETYLRQSIVDPHPVVASSAIVSLVRLAHLSLEIVKKCTNELHEALKSPSPMVQYHALGLLYSCCQDDGHAVSKLTVECMQQGLHSHLATCLLIRIVSSFINDNNNEETRAYLDYIKNHLSHESEMVEYEAANAIINLKSLTQDASELKSAVSHLRNFLTSKKTVLRYASVRSLNQLTLTSTSDIRFWSVHRISGVCILHLLNKRYRIGDSIVGILDFTNSTLVCAKYTIMLQCEETQQYELKQEFSLGLRQNDFMLTIPTVNTKASVLHCVLSFLFYIADKNYSKTIFEDKSGTIELGPSELDTKLFSCDFPIAIYT